MSLLSETLQLMAADPRRPESERYNLTDAADRIESLERERSRLRKALCFHITPFPFLAPFEDAHARLRQINLSAYDALRIVGDKGVPVKASQDGEIDYDAVCTVCQWRAYHSPGCATLGEAEDST